MVLKECNFRTVYTIGRPIFYLTLTSVSGLSLSGYSPKALSTTSAASERT